ncbi:hypothetical protein D9M72_505940 [compost metagenome]
MNDRHIRADRRHGGEHFAGEGAGDRLDVGVHFRQVRADVTAQRREGQVGGAGLIGVGHGRMGVFLYLQRPRPLVFDRIAEAVQRTDARIAAPGEFHATGSADADQLIIENVRRHAHQEQVLAPLADDFMSGGIGDQMGEALHRNGVAIPDIVADGLGERNDLRHVSSLRCCLLRLRPVGRRGGLLSSACQ